jgi:hypothetical protein
MMLICRNLYDADTLLLQGMSNQPCVRFIIVIGLQLIDLRASIVESDRQRQQRGLHNCDRTGFRSRSIACESPSIACHDLAVGRQ